MSKLLFFVYLAFVFYMTLLPHENFDELSKFSELEFIYKIENFDKIVHFGLFGLMTILLFYAFKVNDLWLIYIPFSISFLIEVLQGTIKALHRSADFVDLMANLSGITVAYIIVKIYIKNKKPQQN